MRLKIGHAVLNNNTELEFYFNRSIGHNWSGPTVKIASVDFFLNVEVSSVGYARQGPQPGKMVVTVQRSIEAVITDETGRSITRELRLSQFQDAMMDEKFGYCLGWSDGPVPIVLDIDYGRFVSKGYVLQGN